MKLYVWEGAGVLESYGTGLIVVMANSLNEAKALALAKDELVGDALATPHTEYEKPAAFVIWGSD